MPKFEYFSSNENDSSLIIYRSAGFHTSTVHTVKSHDGGHGTVDFLCGFFFDGFDVLSRACTDEDVVHHTAQHRMAIVGDFLFQGQLHQFFGRRRHILEALTERHHRKTHALQVLHHLYSAPAIKGNFSDVVV